jgi:hypothetical protein
MAVAVGAEWQSLMETTFWTYYWQVTAKILKSILTDMSM